MNQRMILDEAVKLMNMGDVDNAERLLLQAREESGDLDFYVLNNLGAVYLMKGEYELAYETMYENRRAVSKLNPYYYGRMAVVCHKLNKNGEANKMLKSGMKLYEVGNKKFDPSVWDEYGYVLLQSCMALGKYKDGLKLYRSTMKYSEYDQIHLIATRMAVALNRLEQAEVYAKKTRNEDMVRLVEAFKNGLLPVTNVDMSHSEYFGETKDVFVLLSMLISEKLSVDEKCEVAKYLITDLEQGVDVANTIFENDYYDLKIKQTALEALRIIGHHDSEEYKEILHEGKELNLSSAEVEIREDDLISYGTINEIEGLSVDEALIAIHESVMKNGYIGISVLEKQIELFRLKGFDDSAEELLKELERFKLRR